MFAFLVFVILFLLSVRDTPIAIDLAPFVVLPAIFLFVFLLFHFLVVFLHVSLLLLLLLLLLMMM